MTDNLAQFNQEVDQLLPAMIEDFKEALVYVAGETYERILELSPVVTGAYRSEHVIFEGVDPDISLDRPLYESPDRSGPDEVVTLGQGRDARGRFTPSQQVIESPDPAAARNALEAGVSFDSAIIFLNERFYSFFVENKYSVYADAEVFAEVLLEDEANDLSRGKF